MFKKVFAFAILSCLHTVVTAYYYYIGDGDGYERPVISARGKSMIAGYLQETWQYPYVNQTYGDNILWILVPFKGKWSE